MVRSGRAGAPLVEVAPAKINLTLVVHGRRSDGYHQLESLVAFAGAPASDTLELAPGGPFRLELSGAAAIALADDTPQSNLVARAAAAVLREAPLAETGTFRLRKYLPVAAGIGGGSADAAATLRLLRRSNPDLADKVDWQGLAATIGADVPVCYESRASLMWGLGTCVAPLPDFPSVWAVLANPGTPLSTADVFRALSAAAVRQGDSLEARPVVPQFPGLSALIDFAAGMTNHLELPAKCLCPAIAEALSLLNGLDGCLLARMSGSGPTCFALFANAEAAGEGARWLAANRPSWWVRATALH
ncbi:MAG: 4-(cytidine 5'-diphospho)-2-C-methyl-D-erythritol kinase [Hyphomicrobiaceae bacterium]